MKTLRKSAHVQHSAQCMFDLVADVAQYQAFLPWCSHSRILSKDENGLVGEIGMAFAGVKHSFVSRNTHIQQADGSLQMRMQLVRGPFSSLHGLWEFIQTEPDRACEVRMSLQYGFSNPLVSMVVGAAFDKIANSLVDAFVRRADALSATVAT